MNLFSQQMRTIPEILQYYGCESSQLACGVNLSVYSSYFCIFTFMESPRHTWPAWGSQSGGHTLADFNNLKVTSIDLQDWLWVLHPPLPPSPAAVSVLLCLHVRKLPYMGAHGLGELRPSPHGGLQKTLSWPAVSKTWMKTDQTPRKPGGELLL